MTATLILGTRGSRLALIQAEFCAGRLRESGFEVEIETVKTAAEHRPDDSLSLIDQRDVFTRQLDLALLNGEIDFAVHSMKDVPTKIPENIVVAAIGERHETSDLLVSPQEWGVDELPEGARVATSSPRRYAQLLHRRPDLGIVEIRGNVETRISKVEKGQAEALVLAGAGLGRLGLDAPHTVIPKEVMLPAPGQGALAVATLEDHPLRQSIREATNHPESERAVLAERSMLAALEGGCRVPVGGYAVVEGDRVNLEGVVAATDGGRLYQGEMEGEEPEELGELLAEELLSRGAGEVLAQVRGAT
jgi:hydroxymethylbilane synthase